MKNKKEKRKLIQDKNIQNDHDYLSDNQTPPNEATEKKEEPKGKKVKKGNELYKPPTSEELNNLREAETLFHSSLFRLQTDEFLKEVAIKEKWRKMFGKWFQLLQKELLNLEHGSLYELNDMSWLKKKGIKFPVPQDESSRHQKGVFKFCPPTEVQIVGSYLAGLSSKLNLTVDVAMAVPKEFWQGSDYLNQRYSTKRALYLCHLCWALRKSSLIELTQFTCPQNDHTRPALLLTPAEQWKLPFKVCLLPHPPEGLFKLSRFRPGANNVRPSWYFQEISSQNDDVPTPVYNASIAYDFQLVNHSKQFLECLKDAHGVKDALHLLRAWLRNRRLSEGVGGFSPFLMTMFVSHLIAIRRISWMMSSYQVIRNIFLELAQSNWCEDGITMCKTNEENQPTMQDYHKHYDVVFVDTSGYLNLSANVDTATYKRLKHEAQLGVNLLNSFWSDSFEALFMTPLPFSQKFDYIFRVADTTELRNSVKHLELNNKLLDRSGNILAAVLPKLLNILEQALGKRTTLIDYNRFSSKTWLPSKAPPAGSLCSAVTFGLLVDPENSASVLDKGPAANEPEAAKFHSFWGEKSELRRFQDGTILEAVVWPAKGFHELRLIPQQIVQFVLQKHCNINSVDCIGGHLDQLLDVPRHEEDESTRRSGEEALIDLIRSLDSLSNSLRQIKGLSLPVTSVQGTAASFRFTEVFPSLPLDYPLDEKVVYRDEKKRLKMKENLDTCPPYIQPLEVILHMEGSGKWPDTVDAVQRVKAALIIELAKVLATELHLRTLPATAHLDILKDGYVFRLRVACRKELVLLKQITTSEGTVKIRETELYKKLNLGTEIMPRLTSILHGIQQQFPVFGVTCRLAKRWVASHLLLALHVPEVCIELLVAYLFLHPAPFTPPSSPESGMARFLSLLVQHDWKTTPLIINLNQDFTKDDLSEINSYFSSHRPVLPPMFLSTPLDKTNSLWTRKSPSGPILHRLTVLAQASLQLYMDVMESSDTSKINVMFTPSLDMYDVLIFLHSKQVPKRYQSINTSRHKSPPLGATTKQNKAVMPIVGFDPVQCYLKDLKDTFADFALFFYDIFGGGYIGVVWKPQAFEPKTFKVSYINSRREGSNLADGSKSLVPNVEAILEDFAILGMGLVQRIQTKTEKWSF